MDRLAVLAASSHASSESRLGRRRVVEHRAQTPAEVLQLHDALARDVNFVRALKKSVAALETFRHPACLGAPFLVQDNGKGHVVVTSPWEPARPLAAVLDACEAGRRRLTTSSVLYVLREVIGGARAQQAHRSRTWHGQITPEHVRVTPDLRVIVTDHVYGAAFAALPSAPAAEMWRHWGTAVPATNALPRFGPKTDQLQIGVLALALLLGRRLRADEYPGRAAALLDEASETNLLGEPIPLGVPLRRWMERALWLAEKGPFPTMGSMDQQLGELLSDELGYVAVPIGSDFGISADADVQDGARASVSVAANHETGVPAGGVEVLTPDLEVLAPGIEVLAPGIEVLAPGIEVPAPDIDVLTPDIDVLTPDIEVLLAESDVLDAVADWRAGQAAPAPPPAAGPPAMPDAFGWDVSPSDAMDWDAPESAMFDLAMDPCASSAMWAADPDPVGERGSSDDAKMTADVAPVAHAAASAAAEYRSDSAGDTQEAGSGGSTTVYAPWRAASRSVESSETPGALAPDTSAAPAAPVAPAAPATPIAAAPVADSPVAHTPVAPDAPDTPTVTETPVGSLAVPACDWLADSLAPASTPGPAGEPTVEPAGEVAPEPGPRRTPPLEPPASASTAPSTSRAVRGVSQARPSAETAAPRAATLRPGAMTGTLFGVSSLTDDESIDLDSDRARSAVLFGSGTAGDSPGGVSSRRWIAVAAAVLCVIALAGVAWRWSAPAPPVAEQDTSGETEQAGPGTATAPVAGRAAPGAPRGGLRITSIPSGVRLLVDGSERGVTPLTVDDLAPGEHAVVVENAVHRVERRVTVGAGETTGLDIPVSGRLVVASPLPVKVLDRGRLLGESTARRLELAAGRRRIEVVNEAVSYRETFEVDVPAGGIARVSVVPPKGLLHLTSDEPVAVNIDGRPVGTTPMGGVTLPLGEHRIAFRHPQFGEQTYTVVVSLNSPNRLHATFVPSRPMLPRQAPRR